MDGTWSPAESEGREGGVGGLRRGERLETPSKEGGDSALREMWDDCHKWPT